MLRQIDLMRCDDHTARPARVEVLHMPRADPYGNFGVDSHFFVKYLCETFPGFAFDALHA